MLMYINILYDSTKVSYCYVTYATGGRTINLCITAWYVTTSNCGAFYVFVECLTSCARPRTDTQLINILCIAYQRVTLTFHVVETFFPRSLSPITTNYISNVTLFSFTRFLILTAKNWSFN